MHPLLFRIWTRPSALIILIVLSIFFVLALLVNPFRISNEDRNIGDGDGYGYGAVGGYEAGDERIYGSVVSGDGDGGGGAEAEAKAKVEPEVKSRPSRWSIFGYPFPSSSSSWSSSSDSDPDYSYSPGSLGQHLLSLHRSYLAHSPSSKEWLEILKKPHKGGPGGQEHEHAQKVDDYGLFSFYSPSLSDSDSDSGRSTAAKETERNEAACKGWSAPRLDSTGAIISTDSNIHAGIGRWSACWRARMWWQLHEFKMPEGMKLWPKMESHNAQGLGRLKRCLEESGKKGLSNIKTYPTSFLEKERAEKAGKKRDVDDSRTRTRTRIQSNARSWNGIREIDENHTRQIPKRQPDDTSDTYIEDRECSLTSTKVVLGEWWYFTLAFGNTENPGETVWLRSQLDALEEMGYTVLAVNDYQALVDVHKALPDVM